MSSILDKTAIRRAVLPISVEQYHRLGETGIITEKTELLRGIIVEKMINSPLHSWLVQSLAEWLRVSLPERFHVRQEQPLTLSDSEPEPDIAVVEGTGDDYRQTHPLTAHLVIGVAVGAAALDREKAELYAAADVPEYWLVLSDEKTVEVYTRPTPSGYNDRDCYAKEDVLSLKCLPQLALELTRLFQ